MNRVITENTQEIDKIKEKVIENNTKFSLDSQKIENRMSILKEGKKTLQQKLSENNRFIRDVLKYLNRYGEIMDKIIDSRTNYLFRSRTNTRSEKLENLIDNRDISIKSLENNKDWEFKDCKNLFKFKFCLKTYSILNFSVKKFLKFFSKFQRKIFYVNNNFLTLIYSESNQIKEKSGYQVFFIYSPQAIQLSYDVVCEAIRIRELKIIEENKSKNKYLEVKELIEGDKNK
jgi:hypothetical protein